MGKCVSKHPSSLNLHRFPEEHVSNKVSGSGLGPGCGTATTKDIIIRNILNNNNNHGEDDDYPCYYYKEQDDDDKENRRNCINTTTSLTTQDGGIYNETRTATAEASPVTGNGNEKPSESLSPMQYFANGKENEITTVGYGSEIIIKNNSIIYNENGCNSSPGPVPSPTNASTISFMSLCGNGETSGQSVEGEIYVNRSENGTGCNGNDSISEILSNSSIINLENSQEMVSIFYAFL